MSIITIIAILILQIVDNLLLHNRIADANFMLKSVRMNIETAVADPLSWKMILSSSLNNSPSINCLKTGADCSARSAPSVNPIYGILDSSGNTLYDFTPTTHGFNLSGQACNGFSNNGNDSCPFSYEIRWEPQCPAAPTPCVNPSLKIIGTLKYSPATKRLLGPLNIQKYDIAFLRFNNETTIARTCNAIGGAFDPVARKCNLPLSLSSICTSLGGTFNSSTNTCALSGPPPCPSGSVATGIQPDGSLACTTSLGAGICPAGTVSAGFFSDGTKRCVPLSGVIVNSCPTGSMVTGFNANGTVACVPATTAGSNPTPTATPPPIGCQAGGKTYSQGYFCHKAWCVKDPGSFLPAKSYYFSYNCNQGAWTTSQGSKQGVCLNSNCPTDF